MKPFKRQSDHGLFREAIKVLALTSVVLLLWLSTGMDDMAQMLNYRYGILKAMTAWLGGHMTFKLGVKDHLPCKEAYLADYIEAVLEKLNRKEDAELVQEAFQRAKAINNGVYALCVLAWAVCLGFSL